MSNEEMMGRIAALEVIVMTALGWDRQGGQDCAHP